MWQKPGQIRFVDQLLGPGANITQEVGDSECPEAGWLLAYATTTTTQPPAALDQELNVQLLVSGPGAAGLTGTLVQAWSPGPVGLLYVPWPKIVINVDTDGALPGSASWRLNAMPVENAAEAAGYPSCVVTEVSVDLLPNGETTIPMPPGATQWAVWGDSSTTLRIQPQDFTGAAVRAQWDIDLGPVAAGGTPAMAWQPTFRDGQVRILDAAGNGARTTFFVKYDFRNYGDSS